MAVILYCPAPVRPIKHHSSPRGFFVPYHQFLEVKLEQLHKPPVHTIFPAAGTLTSTSQLILQPLLCKVQLLSCVHSAHSTEHYTVHMLWSFVVNLITEHCSFTWVVASLCSAILEHHLEQEMRWRRELRDRICLSSCSTPCLYWAQQNSCFAEKPVMESVILALTVMEIWDGNSQNISLGSAKEIRAFLHKQEKYSRFC